MSNIETRLSNRIAVTRDTVMFIVVNPVYTFQEMSTDDLNSLKLRLNRELKYSNSEINGLNSKLTSPSTMGGDKVVELSKELRALYIDVVDLASYRLKYLEKELSTRQLSK